MPEGRASAPGLLAMRCLAIGHFAFGVALLLLGAAFAIAALHGLPRTPTGAISTNGPTTLMFVSMQAGPPAALGTWLVILGGWTWAGQGRVRFALLVTHGLLLAPGILAVVVGVFAVQAAERSAARGGGLMAPITFVPIVIGVCVSVLAVSSIAGALAMGKRAG